MKIPKISRVNFDSIYKKLSYFFFLNIVTILCLCIPNTQNNQPFHRMVIFPILILVCFMLMNFVVSWLVDLCFRHVKTDKIDKTMRFFLFLLSFAFTVIAWGLTFDATQLGTADADLVWNGACALAGEPGEFHTVYFSKFTNNIFVTVLYGAVMKCGLLLGIENLRWSCTAFNILLHAWALYCVGAFIISHGEAKESPKDKYVKAFCACFMYIAYVPIYVHMANFYTDTIAMPLMIIATFLFFRGTTVKRDTSKMQFFVKSIYFSAAVVLLTVAILQKITAIIPFVAYFIYILLFERKHLLKVISVILVSLCLYSGVNNQCLNLVTEELIDAEGWTFVEYWICVGLESDGTYRIDGEYLEKLRTIGTYEERRQYSREFIAANASAFVDPEHLIPKARSTFASGWLGAEDIAYGFSSHNPNNVLARLSDPWGDLHYGASSLVNGYYYAILICIAIGFLIYKRNLVWFVSSLTFIGIMIYTMLSETCSRQLYIVLPYMIIAAEYCIYSIHTSIIKIKIKKVK